MSHAESNGASDGVGSVGDEAAKLLGALAGWARDYAADVGEGASAFAAHAAPAADEHAANGATECAYCPICRTLHGVRGLSPDVKEHLKVAAISMGHAIAALLEPARPTHDQDDPAPQTIDVDDQQWPEDEAT